MNNNNALKEIQDKYKDCNVLLPVSSEVQLNPFYKYTVMEVTADTSDKSGDIFKVGSVKVGNQGGRDVYADVFSPAKPLLMKLAAAAGIQFDPINTHGEYISKNCYKAKAYGAMRMPDGTGKTHCDEKVINLDDEEDRFRLEFMDKSLQGITDAKAAQEASKMFKGDWVDAVDKWNKPCKAYKIADSDRQNYIDRSVLVNMTLLRKTFAEKAMTGAILRVIRALIGLKGTYTIEELKKPFAIPRVTFSPDFNDPTVRKAMLEQGMNSMNNMFGTAAALRSDLLPAKENIVDSDFDPEIFAGNAAFQSDTSDSTLDEDLPIHHDYHEQSSDPHSDGQQPDGFQCLSCQVEISEKVYDYSIEKFGKPLCLKCQKGAKV